MKVQIETHGCKLNMADSQRLASEFFASGFALIESGEAPDVFVLNSCTVTSTADRKARQALSAARRRFPEALIVATGCYPERDESTVGALSGVDLVLNNRHKPDVVRQVALRLGVPFTPREGEELPALRETLLGRTRASVKIQEGCDQVCAYCIVPRVRGRERSIPAETIVTNVNQLAELGCSEVVLTGTQLGTYGFDLEQIDLAGLLRRIMRETSMPRVRVSSLQPLEISTDLLSVWAESGGRLCPHFHIPLQSGSDPVLARMRRRYNSEQFLAAVARVRSAAPECSVTTDVIAGFPGETDADHEATVALVRESQFTNAHVFPFSKRPATSAAHFEDQIDAATRAHRAAEIRQITARQATQFRLASIGQLRLVLWEGSRGATGLTDNYLRVRLEDADSAASWAGDGDGLIEQVKLTSLARDGIMTAVPA